MSERLRGPHAGTKAELHLIDAGHFAVEEKPNVVAAYILRYMKARNK